VNLADEGEFEIGRDSTTDSITDSRIETDQGVSISKIANGGLDFFAAAVVLAIGAIGAGFSLAQAAPLTSAQGSPLGQVSSALKNTVTALSTATGSTTTNQNGGDVVHRYLEEAFAKALGMTLAEFDTQEEAGKTWAEIATAQGKTADEAQTLLAMAYAQSIDQALAAGKITQAQADSLKAGTVPTLTDMGLKGRGGKNGAGNGNDAVRSSLEEAFAKVLGMTLAEFDSQEEAGKTWQEIATAQGKTTDEAQALLATAYAQSIDQALADGKITQAQADSLKAGTVTTLADMGLMGHGHAGGDGTFPGGKPDGRGHQHDTSTTPADSSVTPTQTNP
jgi:hypothetical protein